MGEPLLHPLVVGVILFCAVDAIGQSEAEGRAELVDCVFKRYRHCVLFCVSDAVVLAFLQGQHLLGLEKESLLAVG